MADNGRLGDGELADIPGGRLDPEAAANWIALREQGGNELGIWISPLGPASSYRTFAKQEEFWAKFQAGGNVAAKPGTSNHGWGKAVDLAHPPTMRQVIDRLGGAFGWSWGEAPSEPWHVTYRGGGKVKAGEAGQVAHRSLGVGDKGPDVEAVQRFLRGRGFQLEVDGDFGKITLSAVKRLYRAWGHEPHDHFGDAGWAILEDKHPWRVLTGDERERMAELYAERRVAKRAGGWEKVDASHKARADELTAWLVARRKELWRAGKAEGWRENNRRRRYEILKKATS